MRAVRSLALAAGLVTALGVCGGTVAGQDGPAERPAPAWSLAPGAGGGYVLGIEVPDGWALYGPDPGELGLPLGLSWVPRGGANGPEGSGEVRAVWPEPREEVAAYGPARVYRGELRVELEAPDRAVQGSAALEVRWAICRGDLCVPGTTRLTVPSTAR